MKLMDKLTKRSKSFWEELEFTQEFRNKVL